MTTRHLLSVAALALLIAVTHPVASTAQSSVPSGEPSVQPRWTEGFAEQVNTLLTSGDAKRADSAMMLIMEFARRDDLDINFQPAIPALFEIYEAESMTEGRRLLALSTLDAIGGDPTMKRLAERLRGGAESSDRVEQQTLRILTVRLQERTR